MVHPRLPAHDEDSGSRRLRWIVELLVEEGHRVTFLAHSGWNQDRYAAELRALGVEVHEFNGRWWREHGSRIPGPGIDVPALLRRGRFDVAWLSTYEMGEFYLPELRRCSPATRVLLDTVDIHHVRERRGAELAGDPALLAAAERTREREEAVYRAVDGLIAVSEADAAAAAELAPGVPVSVVSNVHAIPEPGPGFAARDGLVFVGSFNHVPNVDAMLGFVAGAWPAVRAALPGARLTIVGTNPPPEVQALAGDGIAVTGWVPETRPYLDAARVSIAPLRYGAGVKGKIGEALALGVPVVTTTVGAEGMGLVDGDTALIADADADLARAIVRAHEDPDLWDRLSGAGREAVDRTLGVAAAREALRATLATTVRTTYVAADPWTAPETLPAVLAGYVGAFGADEPVTLLLPVCGDGAPTADEAAQRALAALTALGADPEAIPDVAVQATDARVPVPMGGVRVGPGAVPGVVSVDPSAPPAAWRAPDPAADHEGPLASIVICAYGKRDYTERCLISLERALGPKLGAEVELVLVDNASPDDTRELFAAWADRARLVLLDENRNFAGGNNAGAAAAAGRVLIFLNNDTEVGPGVVEGLVDEALREDVGLVGLRLRYPDGTIQHGGYGWRFEDPKAVPFHLFHSEDGELPAARASFDTSAATGACVAVRAALFAEVGGFDEGFVNGWEDTDLCMKLRATGARVRYRGDLEVTHHEGVTSGGDYGQSGNAERFFGRWQTALSTDEALVARQLGAAIDPLAGRGATAVGGAPANVVGPVSGLGAAAAEARGLLRALAAGGIAPAARTVTPSWLRPLLDAAEDAAVRAAHHRHAAPDAITFVVADGSVPERVLAGGAAVLRVAGTDVPAPPAADAATVAWAATPATADALRAAGWPAGAVQEVAPIGIPIHDGPGGGGVLALLPDHDRAAAGAVLAALALLPDDVPVALVPTAHTPELARRVAQALPHARLLPPTLDEHAFARLAAEADAVLALDADDPFDRRALIAAGAGAAVVVAADGAAAAVLGELARVADRNAAPAALAAALAAPDDAPDARARRSARVAAACGVEALAAALRVLDGAAGGDEAEAAPATARHPGIAPRPSLGDFAWAPRLRAQRRAAGAPTVSAVINTRNEERNLEDALRSVAWVDEIVVCDMDSEDATRAIAERHGARVLRHEPVGIVEPARQYAIGEAAGDYVLVLDADERVSEDLALQLDRIAREDLGEAIEVPYRNWLCGRWMEGTGWGGHPDWHLRFFKRGAVRWGARVHTRPEVTGRRLRLDPTGANAIYHFNYDHLAQFVEKTNRYTDKEADALLDAPTASWAEVVGRAREEILTRWTPDADGTQSAALSMAMFFYRFLAGAKQWEQHGFPDVGLPATPREALQDLAGEARLAHRAGVAAFADGDLPGALTHLGRAVTEGFDPEAVNDLAVACHAAGDLDRAEELLRACLALAPEHPAAAENLAAVRAARAATPLAA